MRRWMAGRLIRLAHFIYRPRVTETGDLPLGNAIYINGMDAESAAAAFRRVMARHTARGWNN